MGVFSRSRSPKTPAAAAENPPEPNMTATTAAAIAASASASAAAASATAPPLPSRPLRLLARLSSGAASAASSSSAAPGAAMPRTLADFHIWPDKPHHTYTAGDHVRGSVVLAVVKPVRMTHLVVALHGFVRVFRSAADGVRAKTQPVPAPAGEAHQTQYHGNGTASLFQDEQVLSGEGRLEPGRYEFQFNLKFPDRSLPSSVDFERGSISYLITATLTRPTTIKPTTTCDRLVRLEETLDVGVIPPPRPRTIFLEPISKAAKKKKPPAPPPPPATAGGSCSSSRAAASRGPDPADTSFPAEDGAAADVRCGASNNGAAAAGSGGGAGGGTGPGSELSDARSVVSGDSLRSGSTGRGSDGLRMATGLGLPPPSASVVQEMDDKTITATIELLRGGCLPGETVPIKISVRHVKPIKSMHGIIVTLYREAKINTAPAESLFGAGPSSSSTDLGDTPSPPPGSASDAISAAASVPGSVSASLSASPGFPFSSRRRVLGLGRSSSADKRAVVSFRKDLSQAVGPLLIDPATLGTSVTVSVRVPEDCFPTIRRVPGEMVSFRYQVEIIADLGGRLANQFQSAQQSSRVDTFMNGGPSTRGDHPKVLSSWGGTIINTTNMSRERGIVVVNLELVVGTVNSTKAAAQKQQQQQQQHDNYHHHQQQHHQHQQRWGSHSQEAAAFSGPPNSGQIMDGEDDTAGQLHATPILSNPVPHRSRSARFDDATHAHAHAHPRPSSPPPPPLPATAQAPTYVPLPQISDENSLTEKERVRRAELRLLPSAPAAAAGPSSAPRPDRSASGSDEPEGPSAPSELSLSLLSPTDVDLGPLLYQPSSAPAPLNPEAGAGAGGEEEGEDKRERERRRLLAEASAPPELPEDAEDAAAAGERGDGDGEADMAPSAPVLTEEDEYGGQYAFRPAHGPGEGAEPLPRYER